VRKPSDLRDRPVPGWSQSAELPHVAGLMAEDTLPEPLQTNARADADPQLPNRPVAGDGIPNQNDKRR
jgi:hypothetical protein